MVLAGRRLTTEGKGQKTQEDSKVEKNLILSFCVLDVWSCEKSVVVSFFFSLNQIMIRDAHTSAINERKGSAVNDLSHKMMHGGSHENYISP